MKTKVFLRRRKSGRWLVVQNQHPGGMIHWAQWKLLTVGIWQDVQLASAKDAAEKEIALWRYLLQDSSLLQGVQQKHQGEILSDEAMERILQFNPSIVPKMLARPAMLATIITVEENDRIQRECMTLWMGDGAAVKKPHPLLERAITGMVMNEKYGLPQYHDIKQMPYLEYVVYRLAAQNYSEIMKLNRQGDTNRREAAKRAGIP